MTNRLYYGDNLDVLREHVRDESVDPHKDTAGPVVNPMIKITNIVALLLAAFAHAAV